MYKVIITTKWTIDQDALYPQGTTWRVEGPPDLLELAARRYFRKADFVNGGLQWRTFTVPTDSEAQQVARALRAASRVLEWARDVNAALSKG